jgi:hypothetical protein
VSPGHADDADRVNVETGNVETAHDERGLDRLRALETDERDRQRRQARERDRQRRQNIALAIAALLMAVMLLAMLYAVTRL